MSNNRICVVSLLTKKVMSLRGGDCAVVAALQLLEIEQPFRSSNERYIINVSVFLLTGQSFGLGIGAVSIHLIFYFYINKFIRLLCFAANVNVVKCIHFYRAEVTFSAIENPDIHEKSLSHCDTKTT